MNNLITAIIVKAYSAYRKSDIFRQKEFTADVYIDFSDKLQVPKDFDLKARLVDGMGKVTHDKSVSVKVGKEGVVDESQKEEGTLFTKIDIDFFIKQYNIHFENLSSSVEKSCRTMLKGFNSYFKNQKKIISLQQLAYISATIKHETLNTFEPVEEAYYLTDTKRKKYYENKYDPILADTLQRRETAKKYGNTRLGDGVKYHGRGYIQITWQINYKKMKDYFKVDLINFPDLAMNPELSAHIALYGFEDGTFTTVKLNKYINKDKTDYFNAREVINGLNKAELIKGYAIKMEKCVEFED